MVIMIRLLVLFVLLSNTMTVIVLIMNLLYILNGKEIHNKQLKVLPRKSAFHTSLPGYLRVVHMRLPSPSELWRIQRISKDESHQL